MAKYFSIIIALAIFFVFGKANGANSNVVSKVVDVIFANPSYLTTDTVAYNFKCPRPSCCGEDNSSCTSGKFSDKSTISSSFSANTSQLTTSSSSRSKSTPQGGSGGENTSSANTSKSTTQGGSGGENTSSSSRSKSTPQGGSAGSCSTSLCDSSGSHAKLTRAIVMCKTQKGEDFEAKCRVEQLQSKKFTEDYALDAGFLYSCHHAQISVASNITLSFLGKSHFEIKEELINEGIIDFSKAIGDHYCATIKGGSLQIFSKDDSPKLTSASLNKIKLQDVNVFVYRDIRIVETLLKNCDEGTSQIITKNESLGFDFKQLFAPESTFSLVEISEGKTVLIDKRKTLETVLMDKDMNAQGVIFNVADAKTFLYQDKFNFCFPANFVINFKIFAKESEMLLFLQGTDVQINGDQTRCLGTIDFSQFTGKIIFKNQASIFPVMVTTAKNQFSFLTDVILSGEKSRINSEFGITYSDECKKIELETDVTL